MGTDSLSSLKKNALIFYSLWFFFFLLKGGRDRGMLKNQDMFCVFIWHALLESQKVKKKFTEGVKYSFLLGYFFLSGIRIMRGDIESFGCMHDAGMGDVKIK
ncbi:unnamed protein product [Prunus armeniaca]